MFRNLQDLLANLIYSVPAVLIALSVHEFAHAYVSYKLGDMTQKANGRLTLNPLKHLDPIGTLCLILFHFGWAKPVEVDPYNYKDKKEGMMWVALAGPLMNLIVGFICVFISHVIIRFHLIHGSISLYLLLVLNMSAIMNIGLGVFNLIPVPPLDGSKLLLGIVNEETYFKILRYEQPLSFILLMLLLLGVLDGPLGYAQGAFMNCFSTISRILLGM